MRRRVDRSLWVGAGVLAALLALPTAAGEWPAPEKVSPSLLARAAQTPVEFLVLLDEQADLGGADRFAAKRERGTWVVSRLRAVADRTQAPLLADLDAAGFEHRSFWIANAIWVRGGIAAIESMVRRPEVRRIEANPRIAVPLPLPDSGAKQREQATIEWGLLKTGAPQVWAMGYRGQGVVVGGQDTGYAWSHPALRDHYRGWNGTGASHDYNWHDSIHSGGGSCGADSPFPCDDHYHGTHTMGTMVGDDGGANQIGMAPDAKWIGCRNMNVGAGTPASYAECFQWFVAPTNVAGQNPDPSKAPDVINNSWTCPPEEGCDFDTLETAVQNTRAAGIMVVASAGNAGGSCSTVSDPPAIYSSAFSVGATDASDIIASFSSRGPVTVDGSGRLKPEVSAPGVNVRSSIPGDSYTSLNGTSMAGPHVVGLVALLLSARPDLAGKVTDIETLVKQSAFPLTSGQTCGGIPGSAIPNAVYGHGRVDALEVLLGDADGDGHDNLADCSPVNDSVWSAPGPAVGLRLTDGGATSISWDPPLDPGSSVLRYDVVRSHAADDFSTVTCVVTSSTGTTGSDSAMPANIFFYLVRAKSPCGATLGSGSDGQPRTAKICFGSGD